MHIHHSPFEIQDRQHSVILEHIRFITQIFLAFSSRDWESLWECRFVQSVLQLWFETTTALIHVRRINVCSSLFERNTEVFFFPSFFLSFSDWPRHLLVSCKGRLLHLVTITDPHTHTHTLSLYFGTTPLDEGSACRTALSLITQNTHERDPCHRRDSNPQSQLWVTADLCLRRHNSCERPSI